MENIEIKIIPNNDKDALDFILNKHYLKRKPTSKLTIGFYENGKMFGLSVFGLPSMPLTKKFDNKILELVRLYTLDTHKHIQLSWLLSQSVKVIKQANLGYEMLISFAQINESHIGAIYQATSWLYCGLTKTQKDYKLRYCEKKHPRGILNGLSASEMRELFPNDFYTLSRPRKARYFWPLIKRKKGIKVLENMGYKIQPYPKMEDEDIQKIYLEDQETRKVATRFDGDKWNEYKEKINDYKIEKSIDWDCLSKK